MIRVLHIHTLPVISGSGINTFLTMQGMNRHPFRPELACAPGGDLIRLVRENGMKVRLFPNLVQPLNPVRDLLALADLTRFLRANPFHIVHTHNSKAGFIGRLAARIAGVPAVIHTVHGFAFHDRETRLRRLLFRNLERLASRWCDRMIFISAPLIDWALREHLAPEEKIVKIYSGIEIDRFSPLTPEERAGVRKEWGLDPAAPVIGIVSKLWEGKGHLVLLQALGKIREEIPGVRLLIVGEGYLHDDLRDAVERLGLGEAVIFTGFRMDVPEIMAALDVAVLPSFFEGMGRVLLEAMAMERPVVASRVGGIPDLVEDGETGFLVEPGDAGQLAGAILKILRDGALASRMGEAGRKRITGEFSSETMVKAVEEVYRECLEGKGISIGS